MQDSRKDSLVYGARIKDNTVLRKSTSGGLFTALSDTVIENGGFVCGAVYSPEHEVKHEIANQKQIRDEMRGAKYVQSNLGNVIGDIINLLNSGDSVLFVGTPCQVSALKKVVSIKSNGDKLITIDIVCHGVPSPGLFKQHISYLENKYGKINSYLFRDKKKGWRGQNVTITTETGVVSDEDAKLFSSLYFNSLITRPSCFECPFSSTIREGDITISDYWGIAKENSRYDDNRGVSTVMINSDKGNELFDSIKDKIDYFEVNSDSYIQPNMERPTERNLVADSFWKTYSKKGFGGAKSFLKNLKYIMLPYRIKNKISRLFNSFGKSIKE